MKKENGGVFFRIKSEKEKEGKEKIKNPCPVCGSDFSGIECGKCLTRFKRRDLESHVPGYAGQEDIYKKNEKV